MIITSPGPPQPAQSKKIMKSSHAKITVNKCLWRFILWSTVVLYTACLPYAIFVYRSIVNQFSSQIAGRVSLFIIIVLAAIYTIVCIIKKKTTRCLIVLAISGIVVTYVMNFETNANKHIHIPEYILMSWILYRALALDYHGSGILLLVFICAAMLGVVDEIMQGIHPQRTYGWTDMIVDAAAGLIGCLSLMGLKQPTKGDWAWYGDLKHFRGTLAVISFGALTAVSMCSFLFNVRETDSFFNGYPGWLLAGNGLFVAACLALIVFHWRQRLNYNTSGPATKLAVSGTYTTAMLWVICPMTILMAMHALVLWVAVAGINFK
jgi:VanZ family protein